MSVSFSFIERRSLLLSQVLCILVVFWVALPVLQNPRIEGDDYRYLHGIQQAREGNADVTSGAAIVENRWDHLWFMNEAGKVRFFRPTVAASYALDWWVWGDAYTFGLSLSNVLLHLGCCLLVALLLHRWLGPGWPTIFSSLLFAGLWAHGECIWYIAGRTDSIAALCALGAFALHSSEKRAMNAGAVLCFALGLLTKELIIAIPLLFFIYDKWVARRRSQWLLYTAYATIAAGVLLWKHLKLSGMPSDFVYPYLISPLRPEFSEHLWLQLRSYSANLILTQWSAPFAGREAVGAMSSIFGMLGITVLLLASFFLLRRDGRFWLLALLGFITWLPTSFVYISERYLYLPSVAFVGLLGLLISTRSARLKNVLSLMLAVYALFQSSRLYFKHQEICEQPGSVREMVMQLEPVRDQIQPGDHLLLVNLPGGFLRAQFAEETLRVVLEDPALQVDVLTMMPGQNGTVMKPGDPAPAMGASPIITIEKDGLIIQGQPMQRVHEEEVLPFSWARLQPGLHYETSGLKAEILAVDDTGATALGFTLPKQITHYRMLVWDAHSDSNLHPWNRRALAKVRVVRFQ